MARRISEQEVLAALGRISYPGYTTDIVALGIVEEVAPAAGGGFAITVRHPGEKEQTLREIGTRIHHVLAHDLGIPKVELKVRKVEPELGEKTGRTRLEGTRWVVAVASGKGGVGKSTVAVNLAAALSQQGYKVGLLDADIYGPSMPMMMGTGSERPRSAGGQNFYPLDRYGIKLISVGFFLDDNAPVIWRGPMVMSAVRQFLKDTLWGTQDFLIVDLPPGTGDAQLTLAQQVALDGVVIVTTPQEVALADALRAVRMFRQVHCPLLGVVENMSYFVCSDCGERDEPFGRGGGEKMSRSEGIAVLAQVPIYPEIRATGDDGMPLVLAHPDHAATKAFIELARQVAGAMPQD
ncbi:MAG TPA: Mrp/NBP35 family ATP-binding protein [Candidatus Binataceae bacterium]|nr:Mrp/NBP35 family ATP-binding protein [Candidatus Binataceae bacterium]